MLAFWPKGYRKHAYSPMVGSCSAVPWCNYCIWLSLLGFSHASLCRFTGNICYPGNKCETLTKCALNMDGWLVGLKAHAALWMIDNKYIYFSSFLFSSFQGKWQQPETQECKWYFWSRIISMCGKCMFEQQLLLRCGVWLWHFLVSHFLL